MALHMLAACSGRDVPARASDAYVEKVFDSFAGELRVEAREAACTARRRWSRRCWRMPVVEPTRALDVLDAGCGTGLCGPLVAPYARRLVGVDLSRGMLEQAREKNVYDELVKGELTAYLRDRTATRST